MKNVITKCLCFHQSFLFYFLCFEMEYEKALNARKLNFQVVHQRQK